MLVNHRSDKGLETRGSPDSVLKANTKGTMSLDRHSASVAREILRGL